MSRTTISCSKETRDLLADEKGEESWDEFLQYLVYTHDGESEGDSDNLEEILNRLDDLENRLPEKTARSLESRFR